MKKTQCKVFLSTLLLLFISWESHSLNESVSEQTLSELLKGYKGQVVYLDFWASWCGPCRKSFPWLNNMQVTHGNTGFKIISINLDSNIELANKFLKENKVNFDVVFDTAGEIAQSYKIKGMPSSYLIDRDGYIKSTHVGFFSEKKDTYEQEIKRLLNHD